MPLQVREGITLQINRQKFEPGTILPADIARKDARQLLDRGLVVELSAVPAKPKEKRPEPTKFIGKWTHDPAVLRKKSLEQLNVLVAEGDASVPPFETVDEAIAFLSKDFGD